MFFFAVVAALTLSVDVEKKNTSSCLCCALSGFTWPQTVQRAFMVKFLPPQGQIQPIHAFSALSSATQDVSPKCVFSVRKIELKCHMIALMGASKITANAIQVVGHQHIFHSRQC